jgi:hypothetical protein
MNALICADNSRGRDAGFNPDERILQIVPAALGSDP